MREFYSERKPDAYSDQENRSLENPIFSLFLVFLIEQFDVLMRTRYSICR